MPSSVARLTRLDHERLRRLLRRLCSAGPSQQRWRAEFLALLDAHRAAERDVVLADVVAEVEPLAAAAHEQSDADAELNRLAERIRQTDLGDAQLAPLREAGEAVLDDHARRWAEGIMTPLEGLVARGVLRRLGGDYERCRDERLAAAGVDLAPPRRLDLSRAELYEMARRAGIEGRSSMTRGQLIDELQRRDDGSTAAMFADGREEGLSPE
jgi:hypothetical protein